MADGFADKQYDKDKAASDAAYEKGKAATGAAAAALTPPAPPAPDELQLGKGSPAPGLAAALDPRRPVEPPPPGDYKADGDPYTYRVKPDGSIVIVDGPTGEGSTLKAGSSVHTAISRQVENGTLKKAAGAPEGLAEDRPGMNAHLDDSLEALTSESLKKNLKDS